MCILSFKHLRAKIQHVNLINTQTKISPPKLGGVSVKNILVRRIASRENLNIKGVNFLKLSILNQILRK